MKSKSASQSVADRVADSTLAQLHSARERFGGGEHLPASLTAGLLPDSVARSWARSRDAGVRPWQAPEYELLKSARNTRESHEDRRLYSCVVDEIEQLWDAFGGDDWTIFCVNPEGTVIHARRSPACDDELLLPIIAGRRILESHIGTTAPSCVLHEGIEVTVAGGQHYLDQLERASCIAVPLYGLHGEVIGALDLTGTGQRDLSQIKEQFRLAALAAEQRLFATLRGCHLLRVQHDPRWLATPLAGVLAVEEDGTLRAASRVARRMFGLEHGAPLPRLALRDLFDDAPLAQLSRLLRPQRNPLRVARADGSHVWVQYARAPLNRSTARRMDVPLATDEDLAPAGFVSPAQNGSTLEEQTLIAVQNAMREHGGNVAAVARQLRVSRTTVYARLKQLRETGMLSECGDAE
ncbi:MAG TPA: helix-turn-helix domain-containing protein [Paraburkholderia sp.]|jgi:transcriptional regulator of acetoin/glycerol metabolism|uniref:helix-turn-helix domain-containing protein n=1 Tax=Paraburkholderia sp. TaxID=1926495 RepID=UPI002DF11FE2|nr:helix-turn-helix domain-containing protein [Paraburkholderia sp.]